MFPGIHVLLLKGLTSPELCLETSSLFVHLAHILKDPVVDPSGQIGTPLNTAALLPHLVANFEHEHRDQLCCDAGRLRAVRLSVGHHGCSRRPLRAFF